MELGLEAFYFFVRRYLVFSFVNYGVQCFQNLETLIADGDRSRVDVHEIVLRRGAGMRRCLSALLGNGGVALASICLFSGQALGEELPVSSLTTYAVYRADMLNAGWVPDYNYGIKNDDGSPTYLYPEVICGNRLCSAQWIAKSDRRTVNFTLWRDADGAFRVAPQIDFPDD